MTAEVSGKNLGASEARMLAFLKEEVDLPQDLLAEQDAPWRVLGATPPERRNMPDKPAPTTGPRPGRAAVQMAKGAEPQVSNNAASNGYWVHDEIGPKHYVAPVAGAGSSDDGAGEIIGRIEAALARQQIDASRIQFSLDGGQVVLGGIARTAEESAKAGRAAGEVAGEWVVVNRLSVDIGT